MNDFFSFIENNLEIPFKREKFIFPFLTATLDKEFDGLFSRKWDELEEDLQVNRRRKRQNRVLRRENSNLTLKTIVLLISKTIA